MAKQKYLVKIEEVWTHHFKVWVDNPTEHVQDVQSVEGVISVIVSQYLDVFIDPRYDLNEIMEEVEELLTTDVPDVFRDEM